MARTSSKRAALLLASLMLGAIASSVPGAQAHGPDASGWIAQAGDGKGNSRTVASGLDVGTVLYDKAKFGRPVPSLDKWMSWGSKLVGAQRRLFVMSSPNGSTWSAPIQATITDPSGQDLPFVLNPVGGFDVAVTNFVDATFRIYYRAADQPNTSVLSLGTAWSPNGVEWTQDTPLSEVTAGSVVGGVGFKQFVVGVNDVIYNQASTLTNANCFLAASPYDCRWTISYTSEDAAGKRYAAIARSGTGSTALKGEAAPALAPAAGWDDFRVEEFSPQKVAGGFRALYSGSQSGGRRSIGWATSTNGTAFTRVGTSAATPATLFDSIITPTGGDLTKAQFVTEDGYAVHTHVFISRAVGTSNDLIRAGTSPAPTSAPHVEITSPAPGAVIGPRVPVTFYAGDTLGTLPGLAAGPSSVTIDGVGEFDLASEGTLVSQFKLPGIKSTGLLTLADGAHTLVVTAKDLDGNATSVTVNFTVDGLAPNSTITSTPADPQIGFPDSIGEYGATVTDTAGTGLAYVSARVTNPLGEVKTYSTHGRGWRVTKTNANSWNVVWVAPALDTHFALPGDYTISILGTDLAGNLERADAANTATVLVI